MSAIFTLTIVLAFVGFMLGASLGYFVILAGVNLGVWLMTEDDA